MDRSGLIRIGPLNAPILDKSKEASPEVTKIGLGLFACSLNFSYSLQQSLIEFRSSGIYVASYSVLEKEVIVQSSWSLGIWRRLLIPINHNIELLMVRCNSLTRFRSLLRLCRRL